MDGEAADRFAERVLKHWRVRAAETRAYGFDFFPTEFAPNKVPSAVTITASDLGQAMFLFFCYSPGVVF